MVWTLEVSDEARKQFRKLNRNDGKRIVTALEAIAALDNPRLRGIPMVGNHAGHWRYRIGDWRVIARLDDGLLVILVIAVGHRREVYD